MTPYTSIFENGKLKPGIYKIQNVHNDAYLDIEVGTRELRCRPPKELGEGRGLWEIKPFGAGYTIQMVEPGRPEQFCAAMVGLTGNCPLSVSAYPVAWKVEVVDDEIHRGFEYIRFYWGTTKMVWDILGLNKTQNDKIVLWEMAKLSPWQTWKLIAMRVEDV